MTASSTARDGHIYYVFQSKLQPSIYKLGITSDLDRRWREHGGRVKQALIYSGELGSGIAYQVERQIKRRFHHLRVTDGNELFCLDEQQLAKVIELVQYHESAAYQLREAEAQRRAEAAAQARAEAEAQEQAEIQQRAEAQARQAQAEEDSREEDLRRMAAHAKRTDLLPEEILLFKRAMRMLEMRLPNNEEGARRFIKEVIRPGECEEFHVETLAGFLEGFEDDGKDTDGVKKFLALRCYAQTMAKRARWHKRLVSAFCFLTAAGMLIGFIGLGNSSLVRPLQQTPAQQVHP